MVMVNEETVMDDNYFGKSVGALFGIGKLHSSSFKLLPYFSHTHCGSLMLCELCRFPTITILPCKQLMKFHSHVPFCHQVLF